MSSLFAFLCAGWFVCAPAGATVSHAPDCPRTLLLESTNGTYYVAMFGAPDPVTASFDLTLYTKSFAYTLSVPAAPISKPAKVSQAAFRGPAVVIRNPSTEPFLGATVQPTIAHSALTCDPENVIVPSVESLTAPDRHVDPQVATLEDQAAAEAPSSGTPLMPTPTTSPKPFTCAMPFADATVNHLDQPAFPDAARSAGSYGDATVQVDVDQKGNVTGATVVRSSGISILDDTAVASARKTTFFPARFACDAQKSSHILDFDFASK